MPSRAELRVRAAAAGLDSTANKYGNDSVLEQAVIYAEKAFTPVTAAVAASGTLTSTGTNVSAADTVTIGGKTYTFIATLDNTVANQVLIGASASASLDNLKSAIQTNPSGQGSLWSYPTVKDPEVTASTKTATTLLVVAARDGADGNLIPTTETAATLSWGAATLASGVNGTGPTARTIASLSGGANV